MIEHAVGMSYLASVASALLARATSVEALLQPDTENANASAHAPKRACFIKFPFGDGALVPPAKLGRIGWMDRIGSKNDLRSNGGRNAHFGGDRHRSRLDGLAS